jgi:hypothetical protein
LKNVYGFKSKKWYGLKVTHPGLGVDFLSVLSSYDEAPTKEDFFRNMKVDHDDKNVFIEGTGGFIGVENCNVVELKLVTKKELK